MAHQPEPDTEVQRLLRPLSTKWVQAVCGVSREAVSTWRSGASEPRPDRWEALVAAVRATLPDTQKTTPAGAGAAETLLQMWTGPDAPPWAETQVDRIIKAVESLRGEATEEAARQAVHAAGSELRKQIHDELARAGVGSSRNTRAEPTEQQP